MNLTDEWAWEMKDLEFSYTAAVGSFRLEVRDWQVSIGEKIFLQGSSGSGKSTLLELLGGVLEPQQGSLSVLGRDLREIPSKDRDQWRGENLGFIFQSLNLLPALSVIENINLAKSLGCRFFSHDDCDFLVNRLGIASILDRKPFQISIGQAQRVAVARALLGAPKILFADEPTSALDRGHQMEFLDLLLEMAALKSMTVLFVSHDLSLVKHFDQVWNLEQGKLQRIS